FFSSRRRHTRWPRDWSSDVCSSDLSFRNCRTFDIYFLLGAHELFAIYFHSLHAHDFIPDEADEIYVLRRVAVDPFFVFGLAIFFARFLRRTSLGRGHHLAVHSDENVVPLDRVSNLGWKRVEISFHCRLRVEVENRPEKVLKLLWT